MRIAVAGASGRMGGALIRAIAAHKDTELCGALAAPRSAALGQDAGALAQCGALGIAVSDSPKLAFATAEAILDFSAPEASLACAAYAAQRGIAHIIGTTGFSLAQEAKLGRAAAKMVMVKSGNMSLGVNLLAALTELAGKALSPDFDIEIVEMHHRGKKDAPSGTALLLAEAAAKGRATDAQKHCISGRKAARQAGEIGIASLRGGTVIGEHSVIFAGTGERITLSHSAEDRGIFASGALAAALWARGKPHGLYSMRDVLGV